MGLTFQFFWTPFPCGWASLLITVQLVGGLGEGIGIKFSSSQSSKLFRESWKSCRIFTWGEAKVLEFLKTLLINYIFLITSSWINFHILSQTNFFRGRPISYRTCHFQEQEEIHYWEGGGEVGLTLFHYIVIFNSDRCIFNAN